MNSSTLVSGASARIGLRDVAELSSHARDRAERTQQLAVLVLSSSTLTVRGLETVLRASGGRFAVAQADSAVEAFILSESVSASIVLVDALSFASAEIPALCSQLRGTHPEAGVILLAPHTDRALIRDCFDAGALCCICPDSDEFSILTAFSSAENRARYLDPRIALGDSGDGRSAPQGRLSAREREVHRLLTEGCSNRGISEKLVISEATVKGHVSSILAKLGVTSRLAAALAPVDGEA